MKSGFYVHISYKSFSTRFLYSWFKIQKLSSTFTVYFLVVRRNTNRLSWWSDSKKKEEKDNDHFVTVNVTQRRWYIHLFYRFLSVWVHYPWPLHAIFTIILQPKDNRCEGAAVIPTVSKLYFRLSCGWLSKILKRGATRSTKQGESITSACFDSYCNCSAFKERIYCYINLIDVSWNISRSVPLLEYGCNISY